MNETISFDSEVILPMIKPLTQLNTIAKKVPVDIEFSDLTYCVADSSTKGGWRQLLKSVNGRFRSGELTAILGPSGAGKSTLLNILAGYVTAGVKGSIKINGAPRDMKLFTKLSSYIMQEDLIQPRLSVREAMTVAANLKLSSEISHNEKLAVIDEVIQLLGLQKCYDTRSEYLSGGQRKRLSVALELVNNPPVIFLDEPTTGLDDVAIKKCIALLKNITKLGRSVICTIHQPSASLFQIFDQVYVMANGYCIYNGSPNQVVPFLSTVDCICPETYTPADFIIELAQMNSGNIAVLQAQIQNGKLNMKEKVNQPYYVNEISNLCDINEVTVQAGVPVTNFEYPTSFWLQFHILASRMILQLIRNKWIVYLQFFHHFLSGLLIGGIFFRNGNDASQVISIFKCCLTINVFFVYTHVMSPVLLFPLEVKLLKREYFNRWFSLKAYFCAVTVVNIPLLFIYGIMFSSIVFFMSGQPIELGRFILFTSICINVALCSQGLGYAIGASFEILNGSVVAPHILALLVALAVYGMGYKDSIEPTMKIFMSFSYIRFGLVGATTSLLSNRDPLECDEIYCHYRDPEVMLKDLGMKGAISFEQFTYITIFTILFRLTAYMSLKYRMTSELRNKLVYYATKIVKQKET
ncbi:ATP-binding cassette sub-family G member 4-like isoform X1 [Diorhabda sublineata]|uniref:ATP-binding cassette sub-family G member 4-like isoform X1 n=1 Tax=Diorhabda sublineata TaxID=1163346 RepID=UPI0024E170BD|nr:ATP-binding cassette sub-family G member 4-like isoform X1 [Diorhabda sublineata]